MQIAFIGATLLVLSALAFYGVILIGRWALKQYDAQTVISRSRAVERETRRKETALKRYAMDGLRPVKSQHE